LRQQDDDTIEFQGFAVVDNNTDEDWQDVLISVVTGEPITFSTDLADSKTPKRSHVDIVSERALGAVEAEVADLVSMASEPDPVGAFAARTAPAPASQSELQRVRSAHAALPSAQTQQAEV